MSDLRTLLHDVTTPPEVPDFGSLGRARTQRRNRRRVVAATLICSTAAVGLGLWTTRAGHHSAEVRTIDGPPATGLERIITDGPVLAVAPAGDDVWIAVGESPKHDGYSVDRYRVSDATRERSISLPDRPVALDVVESGVVVNGEDRAWLVQAETGTLHETAFRKLPFTNIVATNSGVWANLRDAADEIVRVDPKTWDVLETQSWSGTLFASSGDGIWTVEGERLIDLVPSLLDDGLSVAEGRRVQLPLGDAPLESVAMSNAGLWVAQAGQLFLFDPNDPDGNATPAASVNLEDGGWGTWRGVRLSADGSSVWAVDSTGQRMDVARWTPGRFVRTRQ